MSEGIEYLAAENRILRGPVKGRPRLDDGERRTLAEIGKRLGRKALEEVATIVKPETILGTGSSWPRSSTGRGRADRQVGRGSRTT